MKHTFNKKELLIESSRSVEELMLKESINQKLLNNKISLDELFETISKSSNELYMSGFEPKNIQKGISLIFEQNIFSNATSGIWQTIKERLISWFLKKLGVKGKVLNFFKVSLANIPTSDYKIFLSPIQNCDKIVNYLTDGLAEFLAAESLSKINFGGGYVSDSLRNAVIDSLTEEGFLQDLQDRISPTICGYITHGFSGKDENLSED